MSASPEAILAAARELHRFNAPRVANDVEAWSSVTPQGQARWLKQAELALLAAEETEEREPADPFARLNRPNIETGGPVGHQLPMKGEACGRTRMPPGGPVFWCSQVCEGAKRHIVEVGR